MRKLADTPISLRLTGAIWLMLLFAWGGMIVWETRVNRETAIDQAQDFARSIHEMTMAGLTGMMITGTVGQREVFLDQIKQLSVIKDLEVIRGEGVSRQYGPGNRPIPQLDAEDRPSTNPFYGRPDIYHSVQACLIPLLPTSGSLVRGLMTEGIRL